MPTLAEISNGAKTEVLIVKTTTITGGIVVRAGEIWPVMPEEFVTFRMQGQAVKAELAEHFKFDPSNPDVLIDTRRGKLRPGEVRPEPRKAIRSIRPDSNPPKR
jgi:hypothetical protein